MAFKHTQPHTHKDKHRGVAISQRNKRGNVAVVVVGCAHNCTALIAFYLQTKQKKVSIFFVCAGRYMFLKHWRCFMPFHTHFAGIYIRLGVHARWYAQTVSPFNLPNWCGHTFIYEFRYIPSFVHTDITYVSFFFLMPPHFYCVDIGHLTCDK